MTRINKNIIILAALVVGIMNASVSQAQAGVVVRARIDGPGIKVKVDTRRPGVRVKPVVVVHRLTQLDRHMARRLASVTPYSKKRMLKMRQSGKSWLGIAHQLDIPSRIVAAAHHKISWQHYLDSRHQRRVSHGDSFSYGCRKPVLR